MKSNKKQIKDLELFEVDYMVAKAEGMPTIRIEHNGCFVNSYDYYSPTTNPAQAWPIIEREGISTKPWVNANDVITAWIGFKTWPMKEAQGYVGKTSLEAAMRCYVASVYGDKVEL